MNKNLKKDKQKEATNAPKVKKDIESETQRAIEEIIELTTIGIDYKEAKNHTINQTLNPFEANSTSNQSLLMINETELTTPLFVSNVTRNDSLVAGVEYDNETLVFLNVTEYELTTLFSVNSTNDTTFTPIPYNSTNATDSTEISDTETTTEVTDTLKESPIFSSTVSAIESITKSNIDLEERLNEERVKCEFDTDIKCKNYHLICFGSGEVDCGQRRKRSAEEFMVDNTTDDQILKLFLKKESFSENIDNSKCVLTPFKNNYFSCEPLPLINDCNGKSICKPTEESTDLNEGLPFWKVGLISALTAIGAICFIIVAVIAYVS